MSSFTLYILECSNGHYYTGYTSDMKRRYEEHRLGSPKCKYTRSFPPKGIVAQWEIEGDVAEALKFERAIKRLSRTEKKLLIEEPSMLKSLKTL